MYSCIVCIVYTLIILSEWANDGVINGVCVCVWVYLSVSTKATCGNHNVQNIACGPFSWVDR